MIQRNKTQKAELHYQRSNATPPEASFTKMIALIEFGVPEITSNFVDMTTLDDADQVEVAGFGVPQPISCIALYQPEDAPHQAIAKMREEGDIVDWEARLVQLAHLNPTPVIDWTGTVTRLGMPIANGARLEMQFEIKPTTAPQWPGMVSNAYAPVES